MAATITHTTKREDTEAASIVGLDRGAAPVTGMDLVKARATTVAAHQVSHGVALY